MNEKQTKILKKRVMTPAIDGMSVKMERTCLAEIRNRCHDITYEHVLSNGWTAGKFALCYVTGHHRKRKKNVSVTKQNRSLIDPGDNYQETPGLKSSLGMKPRYSSH